MSDLFQRYLDGTLTADEVRQLDELLRDPRMAERFAEVTRLDAGLNWDMVDISGSGSFSA